MKKLKFLFVVLVMFFLTGCKVFGKEIDPALFIALATAIYEIVIRLLPTGSKWLSLVEIVYKIICWILPNRSRDGGNHK